MSYLIALYVYYHGNNLAVFGLIKGADTENMNNSGLKHPEEINPELVPQELISAAIEHEKKINITEKEMNWNSMMKDAIHKAQQRTYKMHQNKLVSNTVFETTPEAVIEDYEDEGSIDMSFFDDMNGMSKYK